MGQGTVVQTPWSSPRIRQSLANGYIQPCETATGTAFRLAAAPVQFDDGDSILAELGIDWNTIVDLKVRGVVA